MITLQFPVGVLLVFAAQFDLLQVDGLFQLPFATAV
jgi:hypothetical protein